MWYAYILLCKNDFLYTGVTTDLQRRFAEHRRKPARFTSYNPPIKMVYAERLSTRSQALKREAEIKRLPKSKKLLLIRDQNQISIGHLY